MLETGANMLDCPQCERSYPVAAGVPVMFSDAIAERGPLLAPDVVRTILEAMDVPFEAGAALRIRRASGVRSSYGDRLVTAESAQFLRRVHASGYAIPAGLLARPAMPDPVPDGQPRCRWIVDYCPRAMPPGKAALVNIRFENVGDAPMRHRGHGRVAVAFAWSDANGQALQTEDYRTPLPLDVQPGQAITLPVRIVAPMEPGRHALRLRMVMEGTRWLEPDYGPLRINIRPGCGFSPPPHWQLNSSRSLGYVADQDRGIALLRSWLPPQGDGLRILEIGGNAKPVLAQLECEAFNVDVDLLGLQVGLAAQHTRRISALRAAATLRPPGSNPVVFICADAHDLPFAPAFFDAIVMFASLHHVPDPAAFLRGLRNHLRPGGFIGIFCEPIGHIWPGAVEVDFTAELEHGVNEQGFSLAEYAQIFATAGLTPDALVADYNSLKARLIPCSNA